MNRLIGIAGNILSILGILVCLAAAVSRLMGSFHLLGVELTPGMTAGIAEMVAGCLAKLYLLDARPD